MSVIFKREFKSYFRSVTGFVFIAVLILFLGIFVTLYNFAYLNPSISYALSDLTLVSALLIPILTMRVFAEERRSGSCRLLYSLPLRASDVILGKYFAMLALFAIPTATAALLPLILSIFGTVNFISAYASLLCFLFFGAAVIAVCTFLSCLTDNMALSAIFSYLAVILLYLADILVGLLPSDGIASRLLSVFLFFSRFEPFLFGLFDVGAIVYYLSLCAVFLFFTVRVFDRKRLS